MRTLPRHLPIATSGRTEKKNSYAIFELAHAEELKMLDLLDQNLSRCLGVQAAPRNKFSI